MIAAAAAQASGDFTWPDVAVFALSVALVVAVVWLILRD
jgi:hypothetical protein